MATVVMYKESDGTIPVLIWLYKFPEKVKTKCIAKIERLKSLGHELRRPEADYLRDGIYELRVGLQGINYRMLYFFHNRETIIISHGLIKEQLVSLREIEKAIEHKRRFISNPELHTYKEE